MAPEHTVFQYPDTPQQLFLLFHGVGSQPDSLRPLAEQLAQAFPQAAVLGVQSPQPCDLGAGYQWFSIAGITEADRPTRIAAAMPAFIATVRHWQQQAGVAPAATALIGFSQGAIMVLEASHQQQEPPLAGRMVAIAGRYASEAKAPPESTTLHLIHGKADSVVPYAHCVLAAEGLAAQGVDLTADIVPFLGHGIDDEVLRLVLERLRGHVPQRIWRAAMRDAPG